MTSFDASANTAIALAVLSGCCVFVRLLARIAFVNHFGPDDCLIALAWAASVAMAIVTRQRKSAFSQKREIHAHFLPRDTQRSYR